MPHPIHLAAAAGVPAQRRLLEPGQPAGVIVALRRDATARPLMALWQAWRRWTARRRAARQAWEHAHALRHLGDSMLQDLNLPSDVRARAQALREAVEHRIDRF